MFQYWSENLLKKENRFLTGSYKGRLFVLSFSLFNLVAFDTWKGYNMRLRLELLIIYLRALSFTQSSNFTNSRLNK